MTPRGAPLSQQMVSKLACEMYIGKIQRLVVEHSCVTYTTHGWIRLQHAGNAALDLCYRIVSRLWTSVLGVWGGGGVEMLGFLVPGFPPARHPVCCCQLFHPIRCLLSLTCSRLCLICSSVELIFKFFISCHFCLSVFVFYSWCLQSFKFKIKFDGFRRPRLFSPL